MTGDPAVSPLSLLLGGRRRQLTVLGVALLAASVVLGTISLWPGEQAAPRPRLVFAEFGPGADRVYITDPGDPSRRSLVATVEHAPGWGINPAWETADSIVA